VLKPSGKKLDHSVLGNCLKWNQVSTKPVLAELLADEQVAALVEDFSYISEQDLTPNSLHFARIFSPRDLANLQHAKDFILDGVGTLESRQDGLLHYAYSQLNPEDASVGSHTVTILNNIHEDVLRLAHTHTCLARTSWQSAERLTFSLLDTM